MTPSSSASICSASSVTAVILAGGKSERMGTDKAMLQWRGESLLLRTARLCAEADLPVIVVGRDCPESWPLPAVRFLVDETPHQGPLGGLMTAMRQCGSDFMIALSCDMPLLDMESLRWLKDQLAQVGSENDGIAVVANGFLQPLFSIYAKKTLSLMERTIEAGRRSLKAVIEKGNFATMNAPAQITAKLANINTKEEFLTVSNINTSSI